MDTTSTEATTHCAGCSSTLEAPTSRTRSFRCQCGAVAMQCGACALVDRTPVVCEPCAAMLEHESEPLSVEAVADTATPEASNDDHAEPVRYTVDALIVDSRGEYFVHFVVDSKVVDVAGPFDDEADAHLASQRHSDDPDWTAPAWARRRTGAPSLVHAGA